MTTFLMAKRRQKAVFEEIDDASPIAVGGLHPEAAAGAKIDLEKALARLVRCGETVCDVEPRRRVQSL